jgi:2-polyprenyl-6-methoxyphenol hydroxylase-like FAD-dependent oxidoreductase
MEHFRRLGIADDIRDAAALPSDWSQEIVFCTHLLGDELARYDNGFGQNESEKYAETGQQIPQYLVEDVLRDDIESRDESTLKTGWRVVAVEQDEDCVRATVENCVERHDLSHGAQREITADYLLGCDGAHSTVRDEIDAAYQGDANPRKNLGVVFRAPDLADRQPHGPAVHYWVLNDDVQGFFGRLDLDDTWWAIIVGVEDPTAVDTHDLLRDMVGEDVDAKVLTTDPWSAKMLLANRLSDGRVFLAGDAAHLNPPFGGHGYNTGVGDAVDIGWKLAAVLNGWGGDDLLETYETERRGVQQEVIDVSTENMNASPADLVADQVDENGNIPESAYDTFETKIYEQKKLEFHSLGLVLGYRYSDSPVIADDDAEPPTREMTTYAPTDYPGARLPHVWPDDDVSVYDELGDALTLLRLDSDRDVSPFRQAADELGIPLCVVDLSGGDLPYDRPLIRVRPDQHVAWRGEGCPADPESLLMRVTGRTS